MDNSQQPLNQTPPQVVQPTPVPVSTQPLTMDPNMMSEPVVPTAAPFVQKPITQPQNPMSGPHKEAGPIQQAPVSEYVRPTEVTPQIPLEVAEAGVEATPNSEQPQLTQEHKAVGIQHAKETTPVAIPTHPTVQLPYTPLEAKQIEKTTSISESKHWLAALTEYLLKKIQGVA